jgi:hypothetical protein
MAPSADSSLDRPSSPLPKDLTVLVVEDNVSNFVLIARLLGLPLLRDHAGPRRREV